MSERPILFSDAMVRAILEGRKTQTRRVMASGPPDGMTEKDIRVEVFTPSYEDRHGDLQPGPDTFGAYDIHGEWGVKCPYGQPGDLLWVRESCRIWWDGYTMGGSVVEYRDGTHRGVGAHSVAVPGVARICGVGGLGAYCQEHTKWRPSIHMPRLASRLTLRVADVRVERLQDISEADALAEGVEPSKEDHVPLYSCRATFERLWDSINGKRPGCSWADSPWVWVVSFAPQPPTPAQGGGQP